jgi:pimeloyl-ACP methyl ester carboxylesterase
MSIHFERRGSGEPILLIHGTGSYSGAWDPVIGLLAPHLETIAFDLPGFGRSDPPSTPARDMRTLTDSVEAFMDDQGLTTPHLAGNSGGAWLALELAKRGRARTVVALGPMGLWRPARNGRSPAFARLNFHASYRAASALRRWHEPILRTKAGRTMMMSQVIGRPWAMTYEQAYGAVTNFVNARSIMDMGEAMASSRFTGGQAIDVPVTVAYGDKDKALLKRHRTADELPPHTRWVTLARCGHVPMADDPELVASTILAGAAR